MDPLPSFIEVLPAGLRLACRIQPRSSQDKIIFSGDNRKDPFLKIKLKAPPVDNRANEELIRFLAEVFNLPPRSVHLISGRQSRSKKVLLEGLSPETFLLKLLGD